MMMMAVVVAMILLALNIPVVMAPPTSEQVIEPSCEAPAVREGGVATVICDFGVDLSDTHLWSSWGLELFPASGGSVLDVVEQFSPSLDNPDTIVSAGYSYDGRLGRTVVVTIPNASSSHTGSYYCQIIAAEGASLSVKPPRQCVFTLKGPSTPQPDTPVLSDPVTPVRPDPMTPTTPSAEAAGNGTSATVDKKADSNKAVIVAVVVIVVVVLAGAVVGFICYRKRRMQNEDVITDYPPLNERAQTDGSNNRDAGTAEGQPLMSCEGPQGADCSSAGLHEDVVHDASSEIHPVQPGPTDESSSSTAGPGSLSGRVLGFLSSVPTYIPWWSVPAVPTEIRDNTTNTMADEGNDETTDVEQQPAPGTADDKETGGEMDQKTSGSAVNDTNTSGEARSERRNDDVDKAVERESGNGNPINEEKDDARKDDKREDRGAENGRERSREEPQKERKGLAVGKQGEEEEGADVGAAAADHADADAGGGGGGGGWRVWFRWK